MPRTTDAPLVAVSEALRRLLRSEALFLSGDDAFEITFNVPDKQYISELQSPGILNLYLYAVEDNLERRYSDPLAVSARTGDSATLAGLPRLVNLHYIISGWSRGAQDNALVEQHLLSRVIQGIGRFDMLPPEHIEADYDPGPQGVSLKLLDDPDSKRSQGEFWNALGVAPRPAVHLTACVPVDVHTPAETPIVRDISQQVERMPDPTDARPGQPAAPDLAPALSGTVQRSDSTDWTQFSVTARRFASDQHWQSSVDSQGHYRFDSLPEGGVVVQAESADGRRSFQQEVQIRRASNGRYLTALADFVL